MDTYDPVKPFRTHSNYIDAFATLCSGAQNRLSLSRSKIYFECSERLKRQAISSKGSSPNIDLTRRCLEHAWATEFLLNIQETLITDDEIIRLSNNWNVVQTYYVFYHATQAVAVAKGFARPESHPKTQVLFRSFWAERPLSIAPWSLATGHNGHINIPATVNIDDAIHSWSACNSTSCWSLSILALRTTREAKLSEAYEKKGADKRRELKQNATTSLLKVMKLSSKEKAEIEAKTPATTLMDYLYRLRIRSNYVDSSMFSDGPEDSLSSNYLRSNLSIICGTFLLLTELVVQDIVGSKVFNYWLDTWARNHVSERIVSNLQLRRALY